MLFLPESVTEARAGLWRDVDSGTITRAEAYNRMLELDEADFVALIGLAKLRREEGDLAAAEQLCWSAVQAQPCMGAPYVELGRTIHRRGESIDLAEALIELALGRGALDEDEILDGCDSAAAGVDDDVIRVLQRLSGTTRGELFAMAIRSARGVEPEAVTERLRPLRLIRQVHVDVSLDVETVDAIIGEGESVAPLLMGVLRAWAQDLLGDEGDPAVENALALLGEIGSPSNLAHLLEFANLENERASGAASWALGRIVQRHTEESARVFRSIAASLGPLHRLAIAEQILQRRQLDPTGQLLKHLSENIETWESVEREDFFPALIVAMCVILGREGVKLARATLLQAGGLLSRNTRRECESLLAAFPGEAAPPPETARSKATIYEICAGEVDWGSEDTDEQLPPVEPVRRAATPGRNDPCWCNSGKKYKKCHLDSDERGAEFSTWGA